MIESIMGELKKKALQYSDPLQQLAYIRGVVDASIAILNEVSEELGIEKTTPKKIEDLQTVFDLLQGILNEKEVS